MKDSSITKAKLDRMKDDGMLAQDLGCFLLALPCFQDYGPFLDLRSGQSKAVLGYYFPKWKGLLKSAVESGFYLKAVGGEEVYIESRFFADNKNTKHYWRSAELNLFADGLFINAELIISNSKATGGPLPEFLELWEKAFYFNDFDKGTLRRKNEQGEKIAPQDTKALWRARIIGNGNSNGNTESGINNGELRIKESGMMESRIDNPLMPNEENPSSPSSCPSPIDLMEDDLPFGIEEEEQKRPLTNEQQLFLNPWNAWRDDRSRKILIEKTRKESWDSCKAALPKQDKAIFDRLAKEIEEDSLPF